MRKTVAVAIVEASPVAVVETTVYPHLTDEELEQIAPPVEDDAVDSGSTPAGYWDCERQNTMFEWFISLEDRVADFLHREKAQGNFALALHEVNRARSEMNHWGAKLDAAPVATASVKAWSVFYETAEKRFNEMHRTWPQLSALTGGPRDRFLAGLGLGAWA
jgi:hypothetical protein